MVDQHRERTLSFAASLTRLIVHPTSLKVDFDLFLLDTRQCPFFG